MTVPALPFSPSYRVLVLSSTRFRLLEGRYGTLIDLEPPRPLSTVAAPRRPRSASGRGWRWRGETWARRGRRNARLLADAERALDGGRRLPLILLGASRWTGRFQARTRHRDDIVAVVAGTHIYDRPDRIAAIAGPALNKWIADQVDRLVEERPIASKAHAAH